MVMKPKMLTVGERNLFCQLQKWQYKTDTKALKNGAMLGTLHTLLSQNP